MKKMSLINKLLLTLFFLFFGKNMEAATPVWSFIPLTPTSLSLPKSSTANVQYQVKNNSFIPHVLSMQAIQGIQQITGPGLCTNPIFLASKETCTLSLEIFGSQLRHDVSDGPILCELNSFLECYRPSAPDVLSIKLLDSQFTVGGTVTGLTGIVTLLNNGTDPLVKSTDGQYTFSQALADSASYLVSVGTQPMAETCTVSNAQGVIQSANVSNVNVVCSANAYTVGGNVSGLSGSVTLTNNGSDDLVLSNNGSFTFPTPIAQGSPYVVAVKNNPVGQTCSVSNGTGIMGGANVTNVTVTCSMNAHTVGGTISGLTGTVTLLNNGSDPKVSSSNGPYTFSTPVAEGGNYLVTVGNQPSGQACTVLNGSGTMGSTDVTNVNVNCVTLQTTTLSVSPTGTIPASSGGVATNIISVTNTGANTAHHVHINLPSGWIGVTQGAGDCDTIIAGNSCNLIFSSESAYVAQGNILVTGDNISNMPVIAIAFTVQGYLVWSIANSTIEVVDSADLLDPWGNLSLIGPGAESFTDGEGNTTAIVNTLGQLFNYAARSCNESTSGGAVPGTWYLPALCQMGTGANCSLGLANINTNLAQLGFGSFANTSYWSSTEDADDAINKAWTQTFDVASTQHTDTKTISHAVRCARIITISKLKKQGEVSPLRPQ